MTGWSILPNNTRQKSFCSKERVSEVKRDITLSYVKYPSTLLFLSQLFSSVIPIFLDA